MEDTTLIDSPEIIPSTPLQPPTLKISSLNLKDTKIISDIEDWVQELSDINVDIAAIQGVTKTVQESLFRFFKSQGYTYTRFDSASANVTKTSVEYIFSKIPIVKREYKIFVGTKQQRGISRCLVKAGHTTQTPVLVWVATSQLEKDSPTLRKTQISEICSEFSFKDGAETIFCGDTQIPSWQQQSIREPDGWLDAWREKGCDKNEKTSLYDRMDRIWWKDGGSLKCEKFDLCCDRGGVVATFGFDV